MKRGLLGVSAAVALAVASPLGIALAAGGALPPPAPADSSCRVSGTGAALAVAAARAAGFPAEQLVMAVAIAGAESDYLPTATNLNTDGSTDYGMWEINNIHPDVLALGDWRDPATNAQMAKLVYDQAGGSWRPWSTYNSGAYRAHTAEATAAVHGTPVPDCTARPGDGPVAAPTAAAATAIAFALSKVGLPYQWGGNGNPSYDCSGLTQAAYEAAGVRLTRSSRTQWFDGPHVARDQLAPGDLLFWANDLNNSATIHHVALYLGNGLMVAAPHTGALIRRQPVYWTGYIGAIRPSA